MRAIPLPRTFWMLLREMSGEMRDEDYFLSGNAEPIEPRNYQYFFKKTLADCELRYVNFHTLRHTFATRCVEAGMDIKTLSEILGHTNTNITLSYYVHSLHAVQEKTDEPAKISHGGFMIRNAFSSSFVYIPSAPGR